MDKLQNQIKIDELLEEYNEHRNSLKEMIKDLEELRVNVDKIFPEKLTDARFMRFFEAKIATATELYKAVLDIRKEFSKTIKDEIELRRRLDDDANDPIEMFNKIVDIRDLAKKVEKVQKSVMKESEDGGKDE